MSTKCKWGFMLMSTKYKWEFMLTSKCKWGFMLLSTKCKLEFMLMSAKFKWGTFKLHTSNSCIISLVPLVRYTNDVIPNGGLKIF